MMSQKMTESQRATLMEAISSAGKFLMSLWPGAAQEAQGLGVKTKGDGTLVSKADIGSNEILIRALTSLFPGDAILSEETEPDSAALEASPRTWVIDPLDGTKAFLNATDQFSVLVALCEGTQPTFGVMLFPARNEVLVAEQGRGVTLNGAPVAVSASGDLVAGRIYIRNFACVQPELASPMMDSGLALRKVATGELDGAIIRMTTHREWDIAAPIIAIREAGGRVSDELGNPVPCSTGTVRFQYLIASNGRNHQNLLSIIP